jgi:CDGSH-type Zn-finger protein
MPEIKVTIRDNGPIVVSGGGTVVDAHGDVLSTEETVFLCRCGQSGKKPFCDGTHKRQGFQSTPRANGDAGQCGPGRQRGA